MTENDAVSDGAPSPPLIALSLSLSLSPRAFESRRESQSIVGSARPFDDLRGIERKGNEECGRRGTARARAPNSGKEF